MASAIGTALISTILQPMAAKAMERVDGIVNIKRDISNLQKTLGMIERTVRVAEEKQIDVDVRNWLRDLVDIAYEARDVLDDFITFSSCTITAEEALNPVNTICSLMLSYFGVLSSHTSNIPLTVLNRLTKDIRSVTERFDVKIKESEKFNTLRAVVGGGGSESVKTRTPVGPFINKQRDGLFLGRKKVKEEIMDKILKPEYDRVDVVVIWGMGGIGKTTLAQSIYNDESVKIVSRKWLCVGESKFCAEKVITKIIGESSINDVESLQEKLVKKFEGNRFLIVLDDVWDVDGSEWDLLFNPLTEVGKGGLIIITRRERQLCDKITIQTAYNLDTLSEEDSWSIFESYAYVNGKADSKSELKSIGEKIVKKLNGHPLALKVVGRSLLNKDSNTWEKFLESKFPKDNEVMSALRWSYNHLPRHLKTCFTYCALFPKHHVLDKKVQVEMWMAHDLIQKEEQERPEDVGVQYFEELVNASLLQCVDAKHVMHDLIHDFALKNVEVQYFEELAIASLLQRVDGKHVMHDLIHDLALLVSNGEFATANSSLMNDQMKQVRHVTITCGEYSKLSRLCKMEKLLTLYTTDDKTNDEIYPEKYVLDVFNQLKSIRVLVLGSPKITDIPDCISELRHLRYLDVSQTGVKSLPDSLCHLYNLQMLAAPRGAELPIDIVNISSLRYVRGTTLSTCKGVGKLTSLQELSSIHVCKGDNIRELGDMQILRGKLRIEGLENVSTLEGGRGTLMEKQILMDKLKLKFDKQLKKSTISEKVLDSLGCPPNLMYLQIAGYNGLKPPSWMVDGKHKFHKLETLELYSCSKLESLPPLGKFANFMTSLSRLAICDCHGLKRLQLDALISLKELEITGCSGLVQITSAIFEKLRISSCRLLEKMDVARCDSLQVVIKILKLEVEDCESFRSLSIDIHGLDSLEDLEITRCPTLELAFEDRSSSSSSSGNSVAVPIHKISTDNTQIFRTLFHHELVSLESLKIENLGGFENFDETEANNFCKSRSLKSIRIWSCEDLNSLPADFHKLSSLEELSISDCPQLQSLPTDGLPPSLRDLEISDCPQLQSLPPDFHKFSSLMTLRIYGCPQQQSLPPDFHKLSSLEELVIYRCPQLQSLPPDFHKLSSLNRLSIYDCPQLQSLPANGLPPSLSYLSIIHCPLLYERCKDESGLDWHKINHIPKGEIREYW